MSTGSRCSSDHPAVRLRCCESDIRGNVRWTWRRRKTAVGWLTGSLVWWNDLGRQSLPEAVSSPAVNQLATKPPSVFTFLRGVRPPCAAPPQLLRPADMPPVNVAVIGSGFMGAAHVDA